MSKLIIVAASLRRKKEPSKPIPAFERFTGVSFRVLKKYLREGNLENTDIIIISPNKGVLLSDTKIPYQEPSKKLKFEKDFIEKMRKRNLIELGKIFDHEKYLEIYVSVGQKMMQFIEGFENLTSEKIIFAEGAGIGPRAQHMKNWILH